MKRERRVLAIAGDKRIVVSVLYRGRLWFESLEIRVLDKRKGVDEILKSKYMDQARTILVDEELLKDFETDVERAFSALIPKEGGVEVIVVSEGKEGSAPTIHEKIKKLCLRGDVPEALRVARRIFNEMRNVISKTSLR